MRVPDLSPFRPRQPTRLWIALLALAALMPAIHVADAQDPQTLVSNIGQGVHASLELSTKSYAQALTTGPNPDGYTLASIEAEFDVAAATLTVKLLTGLPSAPAEVATLNNPAPLDEGINKFTAPAGTVLSPNSTYYVAFEGTLGELNATSGESEDSGGAPGWTIADFSHELGSGGSLSFGNGATLRIRVNGYVRMLPPAIPAPDPANFARGPVHWLGQDQDQSQDQAQSSTHAFPAGLNQISDEPGASTHTFPVQLNEISANKPNNPSGSLDLAPIPLSLSENLRQPSRGLYLTTTIDQPGDAAWLFHRTPEGGYTVEDAGSLRYELAPGAALIKLRLWHIYHHLGRGLNSVQLLGGSTINDRDNRLTQPLQVCLPAPSAEAERAQIAVRGRYDRHWTILETTLTDDGRICADTVRIAWLVVVLQPPEETAA